MSDNTDRANPSPRPRLEALDSLRGVSAVMVVLYHMPYAGWIHDLSLVRNSYLFVDFFFVLSGFIMYYNYRNLAGLDGFGRFMGLRLFRLYPLHLAILLAFLGWECCYSAARSLSSGVPFSLPPQETALEFLLNVVLANGLGFLPPSFNVPSWSISTEFWTYLLFAAVVIGCRRAPRPGVVAVFAGISVLSLAVLLIWARPLNLGQIDSFAFPRCIFAFFLGAATCAVLPAAQKGARPSANRGWQAPLQCLAIAVAVTVIARSGGSALDLSLPVIFALILATVVTWPGTRMVRYAQNPVFMWLGKLSYSIYMVHWLLLMLISTVPRTVLHMPYVGGKVLTTPSAGLFWTLLSLGIILATAAVTYRYVEEPGRRLGHRLLRTRGRAPLAPPPERGLRDDGSILRNTP